ncbi:PREDICTED: uncharacterized oxidoreductase C663.09c [Ceratosolen solmsi marchali]|uniref:Uncharacterized oxidoreductase C663.09c n=1 Tax=Ceratosolen solmsi marchali TaxID=326594 RepID=A0AAJ6YC37_9HYME|nr:PREDICTED: uncharacterized oxidoreductase C663.09c [Ceratosolen solmsi marchali]
MNIRSIFITGCNQGLGLGLVKYLALLKTPTEKIFATCRNIQKATELLNLAKHVENIHIFEIDLKNVNEYPTIVNKVKSIVGDDGLTVLFNNAGMSTKFTRLPFVKEEQLFESYKINTVAPILLAKEFLPLLRQASINHSTKKGMSLTKAAIINMSSILGSLKNNDIGGFYPYRCSKAALNAATISMSIDLKKYNILVVSLHPGWVKTSLGGPNAPIDIKTSVDSIFNTLKSISEKDTGSFFQYDGKILPW